MKTDPPRTHTKRVQSPAACRALRCPIFQSATATNASMLSFSGLLWKEFPWDIVSGCWRNVIPSEFF